MGNMTRAIHEFQQSATYFAFVWQERRQYIISCYIQHFTC